MKAAISTLFQRPGFSALGPVLERSPALTGVRTPVPGVPTLEPLAQTTTRGRGPRLEASLEIS